MGPEICGLEVGHWIVLIAGLGLGLYRWWASLVAATLMYGVLGLFGLSDYVVNCLLSQPVAATASVKAPTEVRPFRDPITCDSKHVTAVIKSVCSVVAEPSVSGHYISWSATVILDRHFERCAHIGLITYDNGYRMQYVAMAPNIPYGPGSEDGTIFFKLTWHTDVSPKTLTAANMKGSNIEIYQAAVKTDKAGGPIEN